MKTAGGAFPAPELLAPLALVAGCGAGLPVGVVGTIDEAVSGINLEFPSDGGPYEHVSFDAGDLHEPYLVWFDAHGVSVFLQIEPGLADVPALIDLMLDRYAAHPCVVGFGVDVEWFGNVKEGGEGIPVRDATASSWEPLVQSYDPGHGLFWVDFTLLELNRRGRAAQ